MLSACDPLASASKKATTKRISTTEGKNLLRMSLSHEYTSTGVAVAGLPAYFYNHAQV